MQRSMAVDDCAMRPLKVLGEENRRKSAPTALTRPKGLRDEEWRVGDENENNFLGSGYKFASDDDDDDESLSLPSADLDSTVAAEAYPTWRHSRRAGQWQGRVEYALRRSVALDFHDLSMSAVRSPSRNPPSIQGNRNHRLLRSMASAVQTDRAAALPSMLHGQKLDHFLGRQGEDLSYLKAKIEKMEAYITKSEFSAQSELQALRRAQADSKTEAGDLRRLLIERDAQVVALEGQCGRAGELENLAQAKAEEAAEARARCEGHLREATAAREEVGRLGRELEARDRELERLGARALQLEEKAAGGASEVKSLAALLERRDEELRAASAMAEASGCAARDLAAWEEERAALLSRASELEGAAGRSASERDYLKDLLVAREGDIARLEATARVAAVDADAADRLRRGEASGSGALVLALVSRVDDLLVERDELRSTLLELWGKTKDLVQAPEH